MKHADVIPMQRPPVRSDPRRPSNSNAEEPSDLAALWASLWRGKWLVLGATLISLALGAWYALGIATPLYTATASVALESREQRVVDFESVMSGLSGDQTVINTEIEVLRSRDLAADLVDDLALQQDPEFNAVLRPAQTRFWMRRSSAPLSAAAARDAVITAVQNRLLVTNLRNSLVFRITATTEDPAKSARLANRLAELYIADQVMAKREATQQATEWLRQRADDLQGELARAQAALASFTAEAKRVTDDEVAVLNRQLVEMRTRLETVRSRGGPLAEAQVQTLEASLAELESRIARQSAELVEFQRLEREELQARDLLEHVQSRLRETTLQQGIQQADARLISHAVDPRSASEPETALILALAGFLGLLAGGSAAVLTDRRQTGLRTAQELESLTGEVVMGQLPLIRTQSRDALLDALAANPTSLLAEAVRNLRTSVLLSDLDRPPKVIMSTSSLQGEGKTIQSLALAQSFASGGKSVLLIEGDIRRRVFSRSLGFSDAFGLLSVLSGNANLAEVVQRRGDLGAVDVLAAEASRTNPVDVFSSDRFGQFLAIARTRYDIVLIDTPPLLAVPDSRVIAQNCDAILYAVKWNTTARTALREGLRLLETVNVRVSGLVLTQIDQRGMEGFGLGSGRKYGAGYYSE